MADVQHCVVLMGHVDEDEGNLSRRGYVIIADHRV
jgi:hypothetical protein